VYLRDALENGDTAVIQLSLRNIADANGKSAQKNEKTIVYVDLDDTLCDYNDAYNTAKHNDPSVKYPQSGEGFYLNLKPLPDALEVFKWLSNQRNLNVYILTAPSIYNPHCYSEKRIWVEQHLGFKYVDKLIISSHKNLLKGDF
jgi:FMN phosphatase YigB (HAD superfamily)